MQSTQEIETIVTQYIGNHIDVAHIQTDTNIFEAGLVNSLFAIELMTFLEQAFQIKIGMDDLDMSNFHSIDNIAAFIQTKKARIQL